MAAPAELANAVGDRTRPAPERAFSPFPARVLSSTPSPLGPGATVQYSGYCEKKRLVVEAPGPTVTHVSGLGLLDNHQVNFVASLVTAGAGAVASSYLF